MHEKCGIYCHESMNPVLEHFVKLTEELAEIDKILVERKRALKFADNVSNDFDELKKW